MLLVASPQRRPTSVRTRRQQPIIQQIQNQSKQYRGLLSVFSDNVNAFIKTHRHSLSDMDYLPKIKLSIEEFAYVKENLNKINSKVSDKIFRDALARNAQVIKSSQEFNRIYRESHPQIQQKNQADHQEKQTINHYSQRNLYSQRKLEANRSAVSASKQTPRPSTSKVKRQAVMLLKFQQGFQAMQHMASSQIYKLRKISAFDTNPQERPASAIRFNQARSRKRFFQTKKRYDQQKPSQNILQQEMQTMNAQHKRQSESKGKMSKNAKQMLGLKLGNRAVIDQFQRRQIQERLMMVNSVLSVSLVQQQGYKPKSRLWN